MKKQLIGILLLSVFVSCSSSVRRDKNSLSQLPLNSCEAIQTAFKEDLTRYADSVELVSRDYQHEQWLVETADPKASNEKMSKLFQVLQEKMYDKAILEEVVSLSSATKELKDCPLKEKLTRAKNILETSILVDENVIKKEKENTDKKDQLVNKSNAFRMTIEGEPEPVSKALYTKKLGSTKDRAARERLFKAHNVARSKAWLDWGFKDLIKSRNEEARLAGFPTYYDYLFFRSQLDLKNYRSLVAEIKAKLAPKVRRVIKAWGKAEGISKVEGWDLRYLREKSSSGEINDFLKDLPENSVLDIAKQFYTALGINVDSYHFTMDLYPRPGKNTHAFAMGLIAPHVNENKEVLPEPKPDIRFLANLKKPVIWDDIGTVIHELGHAIHYGEIRQPLAIFRNFGSVETEAIAMTVERMADSSEFLEKSLPEFTKVPLGKLKPVLKKHVEAARIEQAFVLLRQSFFSDFEYEIYKNPEQDFATLWRKMHQEYWGVDVPEDYSDWDVEHYLMAPIYVQNYAIGIVMVEQFYESILKEFKTGYNSTKIGDKLKGLYFGPGMEYNYLDLTKQFTGAPLTATAALKLIK